MPLGIIANLDKPTTVDVTRDILGYLSELGTDAMLPVNLAIQIERTELGFTEQEIAQESSAIIVLGGDGTLLSVARRWPFWGVPLLGVNLGHLGFLTEVEERGTKEAVAMIAKNEIRLQERMMLKATVHRKGIRVSEAFALNDCVVTKGAFARMIRLEVHIGKSYLETFPADGVIIATPTGSTAYSLSAGGPIVDPSMQLMLLTPICPHMLQARPVVISAREKIRIKLHSVHEDMVLTLDGQEGIRLYPDDEVLIEKADIVTRLIKIAPRSFYDVLRHKMSETTLPQAQL
ncbi:MAG: NAD+ kinase [Bacillota bacterium]|nr:MAG: NAD+ kinase [Bacillota bacterium]MBS3951312.1 NAD(+)/NADH kinase [Peptococcaceae bacterium]